MPKHTHFEELCVLATSGQLSAAESNLLSQHLVECDTCRRFLKDAQYVSDRIIPQVLHASRTEMRAPAGMRERFLSRAVNSGFKIDVGPPLAFPFPSAESTPPFTAPASPQSSMSPNGVFRLLRPLQIWALVGAACTACFVLGLMVRTSSNRAVPHGLAPSTSQAPVPKTALAASPVNTGSDRVSALTVERNQLAMQVANLAERLRITQEEKQHMEAALQQRLSLAASEASHDHDVLTWQTEALSARVADLQSQLETVRQQQSLAEADLRNARAMASEYAVRLDLMQAQLRNQEAAPLPNPSEVSSLVAARNLHIIDVYDSNANGKRGRAFGRVFYVEGRSLVFYAYDLAAVHAQKNITFHLWGEKAGSKETTLSLGVLHDDDPREGRWALTCNDPTLLAKINSVYVTAESPERQSDRPHGPRVLYAYFGAPPNHP